MKLSELLVNICRATGMEEDPKVTLDIQCLARRQGGFNFDI